VAVDGGRLNAGEIAYHLTAKVQLPRHLSSSGVTNCTLGDRDGSWNHHSSELKLCVGGR
jgi:hypothetical protein